jgi:hypothetical protein
MGTGKSCLLAEPRLAIGLVTFIAVLVLRLAV